MRGGSNGRPHPTAFNPVSPDTLAAIRLLVLALEANPEDVEILQVYGDMAEHLADLITDYMEDEDD